MPLKGFRVTTPLYKNVANNFIVRNPHANTRVGNLVKKTTRKNCCIQDRLNSLMENTMPSRMQLEGFIDLKINAVEN